MKNKTGLEPEFMAKISFKPEPALIDVAEKNDNRLVAEQAEFLKSLRNG